MMKKLLGLVSIFLFFVMLVSITYAVNTGSGISGINIETEKFKPLIWLCNDRVVSDDFVEFGRFSNGGEPLLERINNYAFAGEEIAWDVVAMDKNGVEKIKEVFVSLGSERNARRLETYQVIVQKNVTLLNGTNVLRNVTETRQRLIQNEMQANCQRISSSAINMDQCNARILEEELQDFEPATMAAYRCTFTVEPADSMYGEFWVTLEVEDLDGQFTVVDEPEYWFMNPVIALTVDGELDFGTVRPGTDVYSDTILVGNDADRGSGVMLDMFITGTDFYDPSSSGAKCPTSNVLRLGDGDSDCDAADNICYYATKGAYSTAIDTRADVEGYVGIMYGDHFDRSLYNEAEIIQAQPVGPYWTANVLSPGSKIPLTFRLRLPEPCNGDFSSGQIFFWAEAI